MNYIEINVNVFVVIYAITNSIHLQYFKIMLGEICNLAKRMKEVSRNKLVSMATIEISYCDKVVDRMPGAF